MSSGYPKLKVKVFLDGANTDQILKRHREGFVGGFTTNPTLVAKAGVKDYLGFAKSLLAEIQDVSVSFEVFSDDLPSMEREGRILGKLAKNVHVKVPITNTKGEFTLSVIQTLLKEGFKVNVTALFTEEQIRKLSEIVRPDDDVIVSIFAGRIADTGVDPMPLMKWAVDLYKDRPKAQVLWASTREAWNIYQADQVGCDIITSPDAMIETLKINQKSLEIHSLDTVKGFFKDVQAAGLSIE